MQILFAISIRAIFLKHSSTCFPHVLIISQWLFTACSIKSKPLGQALKTLHNTEQNEHWILISRHAPLCSYGPANLKCSLLLQDAFLIPCLYPSSVLLLACSLCISGWWLFYSLKALFTAITRGLHNIMFQQTPNCSSFHFSLVFCVSPVRTSRIPSWAYLDVWSAASYLRHLLKSRAETLSPLLFANLEQSLEPWSVLNK